MKGFVCLMNLSTGKCMQKINVRNAVVSLEFEPSGNTLFAGDAKVRNSICLGGFMSNNYNPIGLCACI